MKNAILASMILGLFAVTSVRAEGEMKEETKVEHKHNGKKHEHKVKTEKKEDAAGKTTEKKEESHK